MVKYTIICKTKFWYFDYRYHETHLYIKMEAICQPKKICKIIKILTLHSKILLLILLKLKPEWTWILRYLTQIITRIYDYNNSLI